MNYLVNIYTANVSGVLFLRLRWVKETNNEHRRSKDSLLTYCARTDVFTLVVLLGGEKHAQSWGFPPRILCSWCGNLAGRGSTVDVLYRGNDCSILHMDWLAFLHVATLTLGSHMLGVKILLLKLFSFKHTILHDSICKKYERKIFFKKSFV